MNTSTRHLFSMACLTASAVGLLIFLHGPGITPDVSTLAAMEKFQEAQRILWTVRDSHVDTRTRAELKVTDPHHTGLVGVAWSALTTTPGSLEAKRTTAHPLWVAVFRKWYEKVGVEPGDKVAIGASASFPALLLAARIAAESMKLSPVIVASMTASNYGVNLAAFDLWHMEETLLAARVFRVPIAGLSPGGSDDRAGNLDSSDRIRLMNRLEVIASLSHGPSVYIPVDLADSVAWRRHMLFEENKVKVFINIGGQSANYGVGESALATPRGLILPQSWPGWLWGNREPKSGIQHALAENMPVINLLDIRELAADFGIPYDPVILAEPSAIQLPQDMAGHIRLLSLFFALFLSALLWLWRRRSPTERGWSTEACV